MTDERDKKLDDVLDDLNALLVETFDKVKDIDGILRSFLENGSDIIGTKDAFECGHRLSDIKNGIYEIQRLLIFPTRQP